MRSSNELRKLAAWYREFAERAGNPAIWEARLRTAKELEAEADRAEPQTLSAQPEGSWRRALKCRVNESETFENEPMPSGSKQAVPTARALSIG